MRGFLTAALRRALGIFFRRIEMAGLENVRSPTPHSKNGGDALACRAVRV
jgi:hypothetical protein